MHIPIVAHMILDDYLILGNREQQNLDGSRVEGHQAELREYLRQTFPLAYVTSLTSRFRLVHKLMHRYRNFSLHWTYVGQSAVVLHWQGTDRSLNPMLITNSDGLSSSY
jgi:hypothetical protein